MSDFTQLDLLRHGALETTGIFCAKADMKLSQQGLHDLTQTINDIKETQWDVIISSPFVRCAAFASDLAKRTKTELVLDKSIQEMNFGRWMGKTTESLWEEDKALFETLWQSPDTFVAPNGESMQAFSKRVQLGLKAILDKHKNQSILLVTHAGVIRTILATALEIPTLATLKMDINYASFSRLHYYPDGEFSLNHLNKTGKL